MPIITVQFARGRKYSGQVKSVTEDNTETNNHTHAHTPTPKNKLKCHVERSQPGWEPRALLLQDINVKNFTTQKHDERISSEFVFIMDLWPLMNSPSNYHSKVSCQASISTCLKSESHRFMYLMKSSSAILSFIMLSSSSATKGDVATFTSVNSVLS